MNSKNNARIDHDTKMNLSLKKEFNARGQPSGGFETLEATSKKQKKDPFSLQLQAIESINKF